MKSVPHHRPVDSRFATSWLYGLILGILSGEEAGSVTTSAPSINRLGPLSPYDGLQINAMERYLQSNSWKDSIVSIPFCCSRITSLAVTILCHLKRGRSECARRKRNPHLATRQIQPVEAGTAGRALGPIINDIYRIFASEPRQRHSYRPFPGNSVPCSRSSRHRIG